MACNCPGCEYARTTIRVAVQELTPVMRDLREQVGEDNSEGRPEVAAETHLLVACLERTLARCANGNVLLGINALKLLVQKVIDDDPALAASFRAEVMEEIASSMESGTRH